MSLRTTVATPFAQQGRERVGEGEFVVALSLDRDWFSPDQAKRLVDLAIGEGLLVREDGDLVATFDAASVTVPEEFTPDESLFQERTPFERALEDLVAADHEKQAAVAGINELQSRLDVTVEAAAVLYARRHGVDVDDAAADARDALAE